MNAENSKMNEPHKFVLNLSHRLDLISSNNAISKAVLLKSRVNGLGGFILHIMNLWHFAFSKQSEEMETYYQGLLFPV